MVQLILGDDHLETKTRFAAKYNIRVEDIPEFKFPGYNVSELKKKLSDVTDETDTHGVVGQSPCGSFLAT